MIERDYGLVMMEWDLTDQTGMDSMNYLTINVTLVSVECLLEEHMIIF